MEAAGAEESTDGGRSRPQADARTATNETATVQLAKRPRTPPIYLYSRGLATFVGVPLVAVVVDPALVATAPPTRRAEWDLAAHELLDEHQLALPPGETRLSVSVSIAGTVLTLSSAAEGAEETVFVVPAAVLSPHLREYTNICRRMTSLDEGAESPRLEVLDMAKKLAHDDAGRCVVKILSRLAPDLPTGRRLFTLLFTLHVDTTTLRAFHLGHQRREP